MRQIFSLAGRSSRLEWWLTDLLVAVGYHVNFWLFDALGGERVFSAGPASKLLWAVFAALAWTAFASTVRRLHDRGKSGWWSLPYLLPGIGQMWCIIECGFLEGQRGANRHGAPPAPTTLKDLLLTLLIRAPKHGGRIDVAALSAAKRSIAARMAEIATAKAAPRTRAEAGFSRRQRTPESQPARQAATRPSAVTRIDPGRRNLKVAAIVVLAIVLGAATVFFSTFRVYSVVTPVVVNPEVGSFKNVTKALDAQQPAD